MGANTMELSLSMISHCVYFVTKRFPVIGSDWKSLVFKGDRTCKKKKLKY
jgi:hypothetical protein